MEEFKVNIYISLKLEEQDFFDYSDGFLFAIEKIDKILFSYASENYPLVSSQLKRIFKKSLKNNYFRGLYNYFDAETSLGSLIKKNDYDFFIFTQNKIEE